MGWALLVWGLLPLAACAYKPRFGYWAVAVWLLLAPTGKGLWLLHELGITPKAGAWEYLWEVSNGLALVGFSLLVWPRLAPLIMVVLAGLLSVLALGDLLYYRYLQDFVSCDLYSGAPQLVSITDSIRALLEPGDGWLFADLVPVAMAAGWAIRRADDKVEWRRLGAMALAGWLMVSGLYVARMPSSQNTLLVKRFRNSAILKELGLLNYHVYDVYQALERHSGALGAYEKDPRRIAEALQQARQANHRPTALQGVLRHKNVIMVQMESFQDFVLGLEVDGQEVTPFLNRMAGQSLRFDLFDQSHYGRSSDGEFVMLNSLHPPPTRPLCYAFPSNHYYGLPAALTSAGYRTLYVVPYLGSFWNARRMSSAYGFASARFRDDLPPADSDESLGWGMTDKALFRRVVREVSAGDEPFFAYVVTLGGHHPYDELSPSQRELRLPAELEGSLLGDYLQCCRFRDHAIESLMGQLEQTGLAPDTVVVLVGDHDAGIPADQLEKIGVEKFPWSDQIPAIIWAPAELQPQHSHQLAGQIDLAPTLAHLLGVSDPRLVFLGRNLLGEPRQWLVSRPGYLVDGQHRWFSLEDASEQQGAELIEAGRRELDISQAILQGDQIPMLKERS
ncbi:MAG: LTA synthase family protein [Vulcanimicrobiota bacterium]